jgi:hypothetical protein
MVQPERPDHVQPMQVRRVIGPAGHLYGLPRKSDGNHVDGAAVATAAHPAPATVPLVHDASWRIKRAGKVYSRRVRADDWIEINNADQLYPAIVRSVRDVEEPIGIGVILSRLSTDLLGRDRVTCREGCLDRFVQQVVLASMRIVLRLERTRYGFDRCRHFLPH